MEVLCERPECSLIVVLAEFAFIGGNHLLDRQDPISGDNTALWAGQEWIRFCKSYNFLHAISRCR